MAPGWNFWKYLVDHNGKVLEYYNSFALDDYLEPDIKKALVNAGYRNEIWYCVRETLKLLIIYDVFRKINSTFTYFYILIDWFDSFLCMYVHSLYYVLHCTTIWHFILYICNTLTNIFILFLYIQYA